MELCVNKITFCIYKMTFCIFSFFSGEGANRRNLLRVQKHSEKCVTESLLKRFSSDGEAFFVTDYFLVWAGLLKLELTDLKLKPKNTNLKSLESAKSR